MSDGLSVYILRCRDGTFYVGQTDNLERRVQEHQEGGKCIYTTGRRPVKLVWSQDFQTRIEARDCEQRLKKWSHAKKAALAIGDLELLRESGRKQNWEGYRKRKLRTKK